MSDSTTRRIPLSKGRFALVDAEDFEMVSKWSWWDNCGYARAHNGGPDGARKSIMMHRLIMLPDPDQGIDHINLSRLDNRRRNLRLATPSQNKQNGALRSDNSSGLKGVYYDRRSHNRPWCATIKCSTGSQRYLGWFSDKDDAARAYDAAARKMFGEFARVNFPKQSERGVRHG